MHAGEVSRAYLDQGRYDDFGTRSQPSQADAFFDSENDHESDGTSVFVQLRQ
jgi:hypothetical protein